MENLVLKSREAQKFLGFSNEMMIKLAFHNKLHSLSREARKILGVSPQKDINLSDFGQNLGGAPVDAPANFISCRVQFVLVLFCVWEL